MKAPLPRRPRNLFAIAAVTLTLGLQSACITGKSRKTASGKMIPARPLLHLSSYDFFCDRFATENIEEIESLLQRYGDEGWALATTIVRQGTTIAYCFQR